MVIAVVTIGVLNLALGFALAILLERWEIVGWLGMRPTFRTFHNAGSIRDKAHVRPESTTDSAIAPSLTPAVESPPPDNSTVPAVHSLVNSEPILDGLPSPWVARLQADNLAPRSFAEGAMWFIYRSLPEWRGQFTTMMDRFCVSQPGPQSAEEIKQRATAWLDQAANWVSTLESGLPVGQDTVLRDELRHILEQQLVRIRHLATKCQALATHNVVTDGQVIAEALSGLVDTTQAVREQVEALLIRTLHQENRLHEVPMDLQRDEKTQIYNRLGLAKLGNEWLANDPTRVRLVSGVLLDVDQFSRINGQLGWGVADTVADSLGRLLKSLIRTERGFDRIARISGQRYLIFFGDTAHRNAVSGAERLRSNIQATKFKVMDKPVQLTITCGVSEWSEKESIDDWLNRLQQLLVEAKRSGRNCTCVGEADGPRVVSPSNSNVPSREFVVELG